MSDWCSPNGSDVLIRVKAVPGASRDQIAGLLGNRLKIRVAAPPEGGKANHAICRVLAKALGIAERDVTIESGSSSAEKVVRLSAIDVARVQTLVD
ncbi:MAG: DUF167 domain-containing protein [Phycisphaerae bacterium]|nr:DUF167 domain-containing protein [Phycisphaerae bacterium]